MYYRTVLIIVIHVANGCQGNDDAIMAILDN